MAAALNGLNFPPKPSFGVELLVSWETAWMCGRFKAISLSAYAWLLGGPFLLALHSPLLKINIPGSGWMLAVEPAMCYLLTCWHSCPRGQEWWWFARSPSSNLHPHLGLSRLMVLFRDPCCQCCPVPGLRMWPVPLSPVSFSVFFSASSSGSGRCLTDLGCCQRRGLGTSAGLERHQRGSEWLLWRLTKAGMVFGTTLASRESAMFGKTRRSSWEYEKIWLNRQVTSLKVKNFGKAELQSSKIIIK